MKKYDVIIIGAGIAGLTAAIYARRANKTVLVLESKIHGGQIITTFNVHNWPGESEISGVDLMQKVYAQATKLGAEVEYEEVRKIEEDAKADEKAQFGDGEIDGQSGQMSNEASGTEYKKITTDENEYQARAVIIAVGSVDKPLGLPNEEKLRGRGVSYCATCDGALYKNKIVAVVGGGNTAFYDALYLSGICKKVYLVHRRAEFRADAVLVDKVRAKENVEFILESNPTAIIGEKKVSGLAVMDTKGVSQDLEIDGLFVAVGRAPATDFCKGLVKLDENGYVVAGESCRALKPGAKTCENEADCRCFDPEDFAPGFYVAGDCRAKAIRQLVTAASDGAIAATEAVRNLR